MWGIHTESYGLDTQYGYVLATRIAALLMIISFRSRLFTTVSGIATRRRGGNPINLSGPRRLVAINIFAWIFLLTPLMISSSGALDRSVIESINNDLYISLIRFMAPENPMAMVWGASSSFWCDWLL